MSIKSEVAACEPADLSKYRAEARRVLVHERKQLTPVEAAEAIGATVEEFAAIAGGALETGSAVFLPPKQRALRDNYARLLAWAESGEVVPRKPDVPAEVAQLEVGNIDAHGVATLKGALRGYNYKAAPATIGNPKDRVNNLRVAAVSIASLAKVCGCSPSQAFEWVTCPTGDLPWVLAGDPDSSFHTFLRATALLSEGLVKCEPRYPTIHAVAPIYDGTVA